MKKTTNELQDVIRESLSPHAVAMIVSNLRGTQSNNAEVDGEVQWFTEQLVELLGGHRQQGELAAELGY